MIDADTVRADRHATLASILDHGPEHFDMGTWARWKSEWAPVPTTIAIGTLVERGLPAPISSCGTVACLAGHAVVATHGDIVTRNRQEHSLWGAPEIIAAALDVPLWLFYVTEWPEALVNPMHTVGALSFERDDQSLPDWDASRAGLFEIVVGLMRLAIDENLTAEDIDSLDESNWLRVLATGRNVVERRLTEND